MVGGGNGLYMHVGLGFNQALGAGYSWIWALELEAKVGSGDRCSRTAGRLSKENKGI